MHFKVVMKEYMHMPLKYHDKNIDLTQSPDISLVKSEAPLYLKAFYTTI